AATLVLLHKGTPAAPWYEDWLELSRLAPVLGQWTTFGRYFDEVLAGEYASASNADEFHGDYLSDRTNARHEQPVSGFARQLRRRRRRDGAWPFTALTRALTGRAAPGDPAPSLESRLAELEDQMELRSAESVPEPGTAQLEALEKEAADALANRLQSRAAADT